MKRFFCVLLSALLLCTLFSGCKKEPEKLRICIDIGNIWDESQGGSEAMQSVVEFLEYLETNNTRGLTKEDMEIEVVPSDESKMAERKAMLQQIRTELMSGKGPDIFISLTEGTALNSLEGGRVFPYVDKAVQEDRFFPLDELMESFQLTDPADLPAKVLAGGKNAEGEQVLLPLRYSIPMVIYDQTEVPEYEDTGASWLEVEAADDPLLAEQIQWLWSIQAFQPEDLRRNSHVSGLPYLYSTLADYSNGTLAVSEEELTERLKNSIPAMRRLLQESPTRISRALPLNDTWFEPLENDITIVPLRNLSGGATAVVSMYCAVNKFTNRPEDCAAVLDFLLSEKCQTLRLYRIGGDEAGINSNRKARFFFEFGSLLTEQNLAEFDRACEQVNVVHYPSLLNSEIQKMVEEIQSTMKNNGDPNLRLEQFALGEINDQELADIVHKYYENMKRLLDEG